jgi:hypothetical protein
MAPGTKLRVPCPEEKQGVSLVLRIAGGIVLGYLAIDALGYITTMPRWFAKLRWRILPCSRAKVYP